jgi:hypothetical protein
MSEPLNPTPGGAGGMGGPISRPNGDGVPPGADGVEGVGGVRPDDARDGGMEGEGDIGEDTGGMAGEG